MPYNAQVFRKLDVDGDGTVSSLEFKRGLRKLRIGDYLAEKDVRRCASVREKSRNRSAARLAEIMLLYNGTRLQVFKNTWY